MRYKREFPSLLNLSFVMGSHLLISLALESVLFIFLLITTAKRSKTLSSFVKCIPW